MKTKKLLFILIMLSLCLNIKSTNVQAKTISNYISVNVNHSKTLSIKQKGIKWKITKGKKYITIKKQKNNKLKIIGKKPGKAHLIVRTKNKKYSFNITIKKNKVIALTVSDLKLDLKSIAYNENAEIIKDGPGTFELKLIGSYKAVKWKSSNTKIATVENGIITPLKKGNVIISATIGNKTYLCKVKVTNFKDYEYVLRQQNRYNMLSLINQNRINKNIKPLKLLKIVNDVATKRNDELDELFEHSRPDGRDFSTAYMECGINKFSVIGENIAFFQADPLDMKDLYKNVFKGFYNSIGHRENMENPEYEYIGIGYTSIFYTYYNKYYAADTYWTQEFYTPKK